MAATAASTCLNYTLSMWFLGGVGRKIEKSRPEMCVDTPRPFCYSTRFAEQPGSASAGADSVAVRLDEATHEAELLRVSSKICALKNGAKLDARNSGGRMKALRCLAATVLGVAAIALMGGCGGSKKSDISITLTTQNGVLSVDESEPNATPPFFPTLNFTAAVG